MGSYRDFAAELALEAGRFLKGKFNTAHDITYKGEIDLVTEAEIASLRAENKALREENELIRQENKARILAAAEKVFAEAGFGGATMQLIADMAGLPKANLHYYFPTKEALYRAVVQTIFDIWLHAADTFDNAPGPVEGIGAYIDAKSDVILDIYKRCGLFRPQDLPELARSVLINRYDLRVEEMYCKLIQPGIGLSQLLLQIL